LTKAFLSRRNTIQTQIEEHSKYLQFTSSSTLYRNMSQFLSNKYLLHLRFSRSTGDQE